MDVEGDFLLELGCALGSLCSVFLFCVRVFHR